VIWVLLGLTAILVVAIALAAVGRVSAELAETVVPALLEVDDAVHVVAEALPFEVAAALTHEDVDQITRWSLDWFDEIGLASDFGEELGGEWVADERVVADEIGLVDAVVARSVTERPDLDPVHVTVVADELLRYLRDIRAIGDEVQ
jgi:hypothetical protein